MNRPTGERAARYRMWFWLITTAAVIAIWAAAHIFGFIGNTSFIGDVSMLALVLSAGAAVEASLPSVGDKDKS
jgi:hypothetical protein